jgi:hypothetical protein
MKIIHIWPPIMVFSKSVSENCRNWLMSLSCVTAIVHAFKHLLSTSSVSGSSAMDSHEGEGGHAVWSLF